MNALQVTALHRFLWANSMTALQSTYLRVSQHSLFMKRWAHVYLMWVPFYLFFCIWKKYQISRIIMLLLAFVDSLNSEVKLHNYLSSWSANYCWVFTRRHFIGINWVSEICLDMPSRSSQSHEGVYSLWNCLFQLPGNMRLFDF